MASTSATNPDTPVTLKINVEGVNKRFKLPLRDLGASTLPDKLRELLKIAPTSEVTFERYSDSAAAFVVLDPANASVYKQLYRAAKAKLKLRLKATIIEHPTPSQNSKHATVEDEEPEPSPVSPVLEKPFVLSENPEFNYTEPSTVTYPEQNVRPTSSVAEMQNRFEDLVIRQAQQMAKVPAPPATSVCSYTAHVEEPTNAPAANNEIPVTRGAAAREKWFAELAGMSEQRQHGIRTGCPALTTSVFSVYCNNCNAPIADEHYHCSTCDDGDYDLCQTCIDNGVLCGGEGHWMIKRFIKNGKVINSTTETIAPKPKAKIPSFSESKATLVPEENKIVETRTCNSCINELSVENFVTCTECDDYDLCIPCHVGMQHGHHPKHAFAPAVEDTQLDTVAQALLGPGRNTGHNAICDGCDKYIYGVRHKCLDCPDWDFCSTCVPNANFIHPRHRFVPIYEPLNDHIVLARQYSSKSRHHGIYCDGPLCNSNKGVQSYIKGDRYKCAVCHDTDFCASCEASPSNGHNRTHPLIKFKTPVRNVSVTTLGDHEDGKPMPVMGDRRTRQSKATETTPPQSANAATQVQTVADLQPTEPVKTEESHEVEAEIKPDIKPEEVKELPAAIVEEDLVAHFVRDVVVDGTTLPPNNVFEQTWYLRNGGSTSWPAGCSVKFVGGDNMCAVDPGHPASVHELVSAAESTTCYTEVAPGQEAGFTVLMRTPNRAGNFISYWRLTGPDGGKFGHRLWCDVNVVESAKSEPKEEPAAEPQGSQMIFPTLEKESPATSIHQEAPAVSVPATEVDEDEFEDFVEESVDDDETEDGFMTDEEYDILDASDEEYLAEQVKAAKK